MTVPPIITLVVSESGQSSVVTAAPFLAITASVTVQTAPSFSFSLASIPPYASTSQFANTASLATAAISASYAITSSHAEVAKSVSGIVPSASFALTATYADYAAATAGLQESASYAVFAETSRTVQSFTGTSGTLSNSQLPQNISLTSITASLKSDDAKISHLKVDTGAESIVVSGSINSGIFAVTQYLRPYISVNEFIGASVEYIAQRPSGCRVGYVLGLWSGSEVNYTEVSTADIGDTSDLSLSVVNIGSQVAFRAHSEGSGSGEWTVQTMFKLFPRLT